MVLCSKIGSNQYWLRHVANLLKQWVSLQKGLFISIIITPIFYEKWKYMFVVTNITESRIYKPNIQENKINITALCNYKQN